MDILKTILSHEKARKLLISIYVFGQITHPESKTHNEPLMISNLFELKPDNLMDLYEIVM